MQISASGEIISNQSTSITVPPKPQLRKDLKTMAAPKSPASNKSANADAKKRATAKSETKKTPIKKLKATPKTTLQSKKMPALKTPTMKSKATPAVKKAMKKTWKTGKVIKKKMVKKGEKMAIKKVDAKSSKGGVAAWDLEAFVKVKFSELEKTAHQKKVVPETSCFHKSILLRCRTSLVEQTALWRT